MITLYVDKNIEEELEHIKKFIHKPPKIIENLLKIKIFRYTLGIPVYFYILSHFSYKSNNILCFGALSTYFFSVIKLFNKYINIHYLECDIKLPSRHLFKFRDPYQKFVQISMFYFQDLLDFLCLKKVNSIIVIDDKNFRYAKHHYSNYLKNFNLVYPPFSFLNEGYELNKINSNLKSIFAVGKRILSIIGTLDERKNTIESIKLLNYLIKNKHDYELLIIGDGELLQDLKRTCIEFGIQNHIHFLGKLNMNELNYVYQNIFCNLYFAKHQTWGLTPFEALKFNKPSIVSSDSGCAEFLKRKKINFIFHNEEDYKKIVYFLENECPHFKYDISKLKELYPENYINRLLQCIR